MRLGIYGGTFSPPHNGHTEAAGAFIREMRLDKLLIIPTFIPPHKISFDNATPDDRLEMCKLAFSDIDNIEISDMEIKRGGKSYTYLTLEELSSDGVELFFLCGTDMILTFDEWKRYDYIFSLATICYARRENDEQNTLKIEEKVEQYRKLGAKIVEIKHKVNEISSTEIKAMLKDKKEYIPVSKSVLDYIYSKQIYVPVDGKFDFNDVNQSIELEDLRNRVKPLVSERRFLHILGVEKAAKKIAEPFGEKMVLKARIAALLHDVTKEMPQDKLVCEYGIQLSDDDRLSAETLHALTAVPYVKKHFSEFSEEDILFAVKTHTTGDEHMSLLGKILFVADYVEEGRKYDSSVALRKELYSALDSSRNTREAAVALDKAVVSSINFTLSFLESGNKFIHPKTICTKNAILKNILIDQG